MTDKRHLPINTEVEPFMGETYTVELQWPEQA